MNQFDPQSMAFEMFKGEVPCLFAVVGDEECTKPATHTITMDHINVPDCGKLVPNPAPVCDEHKRLMVQAFNPFWRSFLGTPIPTCVGGCDQDITLGEVRKL